MVSAGWLILAVSLAAPPPPPRPPLLRYAPVAVEKAAPPARFAAPLPRVKELEPIQWVYGWGRDRRFAPSAYARDLLCAGDGEMWRRLDAALAASVRDGATWVDAYETWGTFLMHCREGCGVVPRVEPGAGPAALPAWLVAATCRDGAARKLFARPDVPGVALLARETAVRYDAPGDRPAPARVAAAALDLLRSGAVQGRRGAAMTLVETGDPAAIAALLALAVDEPDEDRRTELQTALCDSDVPAVYRGLDALGCTGRSRRGAAPGNAAPPSEPTAAELAERLRHGNVDDVIDHTPAPLRDRLLAGLEACARDDEREFDAMRWRVRCLAGLARLDRPRAVAVAAALPRPRSPEGRELVVALTRYPKPGALEARLRALGLVPPGAHAAGVTPRQVLEAAGAAIETPFEGMGVPPEMDSVLRTVWALPGGPRTSALFEEIPPEGDARRDPYLLVASLDGLRFETPAENHGEYYDTEAILGLVNAIERHRGRSRRVAPFVGGFYGGGVLVSGPERGILAAVAEGLLDAGLPERPPEAPGDPGRLPGGLRFLPDQDAAPEAPGAHPR